MSSTRLRSTTASLLVLLGGACASSQPPPRELADAREAYNRAVAGPGAELAPAQLHTAKDALDHAEHSFGDHPDSQDTRDLAYLAQRKAQIADSIANAELAKQQKAQADKAMLTVHQEAHEAAEEQLKTAREQLIKAQMEAKEALGKLASLKNSVKEDERGLVITLSGAVLFGSNKSELLPAARGQLDEIARALAGAKAQKISIEGHTDKTGRPAHNINLSQERARAVADYLAQRGLPMSTMQAIGHGPARPIATNLTAEGRATNRRVEIIVQGASGSEAAADGDKK